MEFIKSTTSDQLILNGFHYPPNEQKNICVLFIHGMSGLFIENYFADVMGNTFSKHGIGYLYGHNRGYSHINDIRTTKINPNNSNQTTRVGAVYERFLDSEYDIKSWINTVFDLGYKQIVLVGHSLGAPKVINYLHTNSVDNLSGVVLMSPADMIGLAVVEDNYQKLLSEAKDYIHQNKPKQILSELFWDWYYLSAQTFLDLFEENGPADILPVRKNPKNFKHLESIKSPLMLIMGEYDDIAIRTLIKDIDLIESKALNANPISKIIIDGADHSYSNKEVELANHILKWVNQL